MLKGAQKRMVMLRPADSSLFETAYFILRDNGDASADNKQPTMLEEANRILDQSFTPRTAGKNKKEGRSRRMLRWTLAFLLGCLVGGALCAVVLTVGI